MIGQKEQLHHFSANQWRSMNLTSECLVKFVIKPVLIGYSNEYIIISYKENIFGQ